jgi:hypothetical protein
MPESRVWKTLCSADSEITAPYRQAWLSKCDDWPVIYELSLELAGALTTHPCDEPAVFSLREFDVLHDRLWDRVAMCWRSGSPRRTA